MALLPSHQRARGSSNQAFHSVELALRVPVERELAVVVPRGRPSSHRPSDCCDPTLQTELLCLARVGVATRRKDPESQNLHLDQGTSFLLFASASRDARHLVLDAEVDAGPESTRR
jgi:hypothetical protein